MSGSNPERRKAGLPLGLVGMVVLVIATENFLEGHRLDFASPWSEDWRFASWAARHEAKKCDVLFFGDSLVKYGLLPKVVEARTGLKAYNVANAGGTMPSAYFLLRQAIESGARPKALVVDFAALQQSDPDPPHLMAYPELASIGDCLDLARTSKSASFFAAAMACKALPSYKWRFEIKGAIRAALDARKISPRQFTVEFEKMWHHERGAQPMNPEPAHPPASDALLDGVSPYYFAWEQRNRDYLERFLALAEQHKITVFWLMPPLAPEVHVRRAIRGTDRIFGDFARLKMAEHKNIVVLDARLSGYDDSVHIDHLHLDRRGASVLSADVATALADHLGDKPVLTESGWVAMPAYAGRTGDEPAAAIARVPASGPAR